MVMMATGIFFLIGYAMGAAQIMIIRHIQDGEDSD